MRIFAQPNLLNRTEGSKPKWVSKISNQNSLPMYKYILLLIVAFSFFSSSAQHTPWRAGEMEVKVSFTNPDQAQRIAALDFKGDIYNSHAWLYLTPYELEELKQTDVSYSINIPDLNKWSASFGPMLVPPGYYSFNQIKNIADSLTTHFPDICKKVIYGYTPQMKELAALKISDNVNVDENEAEILFDGGIHGNEVGASQNVIQFARDLCLAYGTDTYITNMVNNREIWLYYCVNPYGRDNMTRENGNQVDINRDYGYVWGGEGGSIGPFSQPETKALRDCQYSNQFVSYTNYHSGTEIISYPWSYRYSPTPDNEHIMALAHIYSVNSDYPTLPYGQGSQVMYLIKGSTKDFNYGCLGSVAWSMEISLDKQPAGPNIQYYYNINKPAMLALIEHAGYGIEGTVTDAVTGMPVSASIWVGNNYPTYTDGEAGDYHKYMVAGTYNLRFTANGYQSLVIENVNVNSLQSTNTDVQLQPLSSHYGYRVSRSRIPNFNAQNPGDEGYSAACLGAPDQVNYSIGKGGYIMVDMQTPVIDKDGPDIEIHEGDLSQEGYAVYALTDMDGFWNYIGSGMGTAQFDLASGGIPEAQFFVLLDDNDGAANVNDAGFDFDAIENLHPAIPDTLAHLSGKVLDYFTGLPLVGAKVYVADYMLVTDTAGYYSLDPVRGSYIACAEMDNYNSKCDTLQLTSGVKSNHDFYLDFNVSFKEIKVTEALTVNPNPFSDELNIQFRNENAGRVQIILTPLNGGKSVVLTDRKFPAGDCEFKWLVAENNKNLTPGIYIVSIETEVSRQICKVIKISF